MAENTLEAIRAIAAAAPSHRPRMIDAFMRARLGLFRQIAYGLCRTYGLAADQHADDFASMVAETAYTTLARQIEDPEELDTVMIWEAKLRLTSRQVVREFLDKEMAPATQMTSVFRRLRVLNQTRDAMRMEFGREPSDREVVDEHNARMRKSRSNAAKQGVLASVDDLGVYRAAADVDDHDRSEPVDTDFVLHPVEGPKFIKLLVERTAAYNERLGEAASLWLSGLYREDGPPMIATAEEIAEALDVSKSTARAYIRKIKEYAVVVAQEEFNITEDDVA